MFNAELSNKAVCAEVLRHSLDGLRNSYGDEAVTYAVLELLTDGLPAMDQNDRDAQEAFLREAMDECIATAEGRETPVVVAAG